MDILGRIKSISKEAYIKIICIIAYLLLFYSFMYSDILITTSHAINLWDILFKGEIFHYYDLCVSDISNSAYEIFNIPGYDFLIYIVFALWNLPLWLARRFFSVNIWESAIAIAWAKSIVLLFTVLTIHCMSKICHTVCLNKKREKQVILLFLTSAIMTGSIIVMSQYDIIYLYLMLEALNYYLKKDMKKFTVFMAIALPFKPLSLFMFAPLLLYKEKNILKIALHTVAVFIPYFLLKVIFPAGVNAAYVQNMLVMFKNKIEIAHVEIPTYFLCVFVFYFICYILQTPEDDKKFYANSIFIAFIAYAIFFIVCGGNPYWSILILPFWCLMIGMNDNYILLGTILESIASIAFMASYVWAVPWAFDAKTIRSTYIAKIFGNRFDATNNILEMIHGIVPSLYDLALERIEGILFGIFFAAVIATIYIYCHNSKECAFKGKEISNYVFIIRAVLSFSVCLIPFIAYIW